jgi:hypothetical protein
MQICRFHAVAGAIAVTPVTYNTSTVTVTVTLGNSSTDVAVHDLA